MLYNVLCAARRKSQGTEELFPLCDWVGNRQRWTNARNRRQVYQALIRISDSDKAKMLDAEDSSDRLQAMPESELSALRCCQKREEHDAE